jgi:rubrerythrin
MPRIGDYEVKKKFQIGTNDWNYEVIKYFKDGHNETIWSGATEAAAYRAIEVDKGDHPYNPLNSSYNIGDTIWFKEAGEPVSGVIKEMDDKYYSVAFRGRIIPVKKEDVIKDYRNSSGDDGLLNIEIEGEKSAEAHYRQSAEKATDPKVKALLLHIADEEFVHAEELTKMLKEVTTMKNANSHNYTIKKTKSYTSDEMIWTVYEDGKDIDEFVDESDAKSFVERKKKEGFQNSIKTPEDRRNKGEELFGMKINDNSDSIYDSLKPNVKKLVDFIAKKYNGEAPASVSDLRNKLAYEHITYTEDDLKEAVAFTGAM